MQMYIVFGVFFLFVVLILSGKVKIHVAAMMIPIVLEITGDGFNRVTGGMSPLLIMISMYLVCMILTQFITNSAVGNAFRTMAALIAVQSGYDARALMLAVAQGSGNCYLTSMAAPAMTMGFESGGYTTKQFMKQGLILSAVRFLAFVLWVPFVFPLK